MRIRSNEHCVRKPCTGFLHDPRNSALCLNAILSRRFIGYPPIRWHEGLPNVPIHLPMMITAKLTVLASLFLATLSVQAAPSNLASYRSNTAPASRALQERTSGSACKAVVHLAGNSAVTGNVVFEQAAPGAPVSITADISGLDPSSLRGWHIHQAGNLTDGCTSASTHFNPYGQTHGAPTDHVRHVGDLGNIKSDEHGHASFVQWDDFISLEGERNIVGRAIVVHASTDDLGKGGNDESLKTGNAGARSACGVIGWA
ncbi:superoxide dismutase [Mucidula mucida]|nr:superoxide dismutase [Mucidula mucida]